MPFSCLFEEVLRVGRPPRLRETWLHAFSCARLDTGSVCRQSLPDSLSSTYRRSPPASSSMTPGTSCSPGRSRKVRGTISPIRHRLGLLPPYPPGFAALLSLVFHPRSRVSTERRATEDPVDCGNVRRRHRELSVLHPLPRHDATTCPWPGVRDRRHAGFRLPGDVDRDVRMRVHPFSTRGGRADRQELDRQDPERRSSYYRCTLLAAGLAAGTVLIRSAGVPLVAAIVLHLLARRHWRQALLFCVAVVLCVAPWTWFARTHEPTRESGSRTAARRRSPTVNTTRCSGRAGQRWYRLRT